MDARDRLIVALDVAGEGEARALLARLSPGLRSVKVGKQLFVSAGPDLACKLAAQGLRVFLDLKLHDIPNTVALAVREAVKLGATLIDMHASGGSAMMRAAADAAADEAARLGAARPKLLGVTVLTSLDDAALAETGVRGTVADQVVRLAVLARKAGLDGVVASPREIAAVRAACGKDFLIVTPGIRGTFDAGSSIEVGSRAHGARDLRSGKTGDDQARTMTAAEAIHAGADFLVVGRPVIAAVDPAAVFERLAGEVAAALGERA